MGLLGHGGEEFGDADGVVETGTGGAVGGAEAGGLDGAGEILGSEHAVDAAGGFPAFGHGVDHLASAIGAITADIESGHAGLHRLGVVLDAALAVELEVGEEAVEKGRLLFLSHGFEYKIERFDPFAARDDDDLAVAHFREGKAKSFDVAVLGEDLGGDCVEEECGPVGFGEVVFKMVGGHVGFAAAVDDGGDLGAEAAGLGDGVDGGVAATEYGDAAADGNFVEGAGVDPLDEVEGVHDFGEVFAGDAEAVGTAEAEAKEEGVVVALEVGEGEVASDFHTIAEVDAEAFDHGDLLEADLGRHFVVGDAVGVESAAGGFLVEDSDFVAELREFGGTTESGGSGPEDGNFPAVALCGGVEDVDLVLVNVVGGVALEAADLHRIALEVEDDAGAFAEDFRGADAGAACAEDVRGEDRAGGAGEVAVGDFFYERGDVDARGAGHDAGGVEAEEAAVRLNERLLRCVPGLNLRHLGGGRPGVKERLDGHGLGETSFRFQFSVVQ